VSFVLEDVELARKAFAESRFEDVVARLAGWVAPLMVYHRTPEGASLEPRTRAEIARALGLLGETFARLLRNDESEETLRLAVQYAQDSPAGAELYCTLARVMIGQERYAEAIGPLRRALVLDPQGPPELLVDLAQCYLKAGRAVAALGCVRQALVRHVQRDRVDAIDRELREVLGTAMERFETLVDGAETTSPAIEKARG
jgi:tetratricopeptide (TPR) repeat protein